MTHLTSRSSSVYSRCLNYLSQARPYAEIMAPQTVQYSSPRDEPWETEAAPLTVLGVVKWHNFTEMKLNSPKVHKARNNLGLFERTFIVMNHEHTSTQHTTCSINPTELKINMQSWNQRSRNYIFFWCFWKCHAFRGIVSGNMCVRILAQSYMSRSKPLMSAW